MVFTGLSTYICRYAELNISCEKHSDIGVYSLLYLLGVLALFFFPCGCQLLLIFAFQITFYAKCHQVLVHAGGGNLWREFSDLGGWFHHAGFRRHTAGTSDRWGGCTALCHLAMIFFVGCNQKIVKFVKRYFVIQLLDCINNYCKKLVPLSNHQSGQFTMGL